MKGKLQALNEEQAALSISMNYFTDVVSFQRVGARGWWVGGCENMRGLSTFSSNRVKPVARLCIHDPAAHRHTLPCQVAWEPAETEGRLLLRLIYTTHGSPSSRQPASRHCCRCWRASWRRRRALTTRLPPTSSSSTSWTTSTCPAWTPMRRPWWEALPPACAAAGAAAPCRGEARRSHALPQHMACT